jgi:uncharacterized membrane protein
VVIITIIEGSVFSDRYLNSKQLNYETKRYGVYHYYRNWITVKALNVVWATSAFLVSAVVLLPRVKSFINAVGNKWHSSIKYRENCYARVERIHSYYEKGIISKEEYERTKEDILKHIGK